MFHCVKPGHEDPLEVVEDALERLGSSGASAGSALLIAPGFTFDSTGFSSDH